MLSQADAAEGVRTFRRWRDEAEGAEGLYDRRLGRASARRAGADEVARILELFDTRYRDFNARHFHEKLVACVQRSWVRLTLQAHGRTRAAPRRPPAQAPAPGVARVARLTLDARSAVGVTRRHQRDPRSSSPKKAPCRASGRSTRWSAGCSVYRGSHYFHTPEAGGKVDKDKPTQVRRALCRPCLLA